MNAPTTADFKAYFTRDFPFGASNNTVLDSDIDKALFEAGMNFNEALWADQAQYTVGYLYLTAHYLVMDLRASSQGIAGTYPWLTTSKGVGSVSEGMAVPDFVMNNPVLAHLGKTYYGSKYISLIYHKLLGNVALTAGATTP